jgi:hypothetical protein
MNQDMLLPAEGYCNSDTRPEAEDPVDAYQSTQ